MIYLKDVNAFEELLLNSFLYRTINNLIQTVKRFHSVIKNNGLLTSDIQQDYNQVIEQVLGDKEITWADENIEDDNSNVDGITLERITHFSVLNSVSLSRKYFRITAFHFNFHFCCMHLKFPFFFFFLTTDFRIS